MGRPFPFYSIAKKEQSYLLLDNHSTNLRNKVGNNYD